MQNTYSEMIQESLKRRKNQFALPNSKIYYKNNNKQVHIVGKN